MPLPPTFNGFDVLEIAPRERLTYAIKNNYVILGEQHQRQVKWRNEPSESVLDFTVFQDSQEQRREIQDFFDAHTGRTVPFWVLSYKDDIEFAEPATAPSAFLVVRLLGSEADELRFDLEFHTRYIYIRSTDSLHKILGFTTDEVLNRLTLEVVPPIPTDVEPGDRAQFFYFVRFSEDEFAIEADQRFNREATDPVINDAYSSSARLRFVELQRETV